MMAKSEKAFRRAAKLLLPVLRAGENAAERASVRLLCSESSEHHTVMISFPGLNSDPLQAPYLDELNLSLLNHYAGYVFSRQTAAGWDVCVQM